MILPALLLVALAAMAVYATSNSGRDADDPAAELASTPVACQGATLVAKLTELHEASGLTLSTRDRSLFWSHNDSAQPAVIGVSADGALRARVRLPGASVIDWEAVTTAPCASGTCLYVGDIGDNDRRRRTITVYRTAEPSPGDESTPPVEKIEASYPEGPQDAEALFVANGSLFVVTKGEGSPIRVYRFPSLEGAGPHTLQLVAALTDDRSKKKSRITDAAVSPNGRWVAMRTNDVVFFYKTDAVLAGQPGTPLSFDLEPLNEPQGEGIAWSDDQTLFLAGESEGGGTFGRVSCNLPS